MIRDQSKTAIQIQHWFELMTTERLDGPLLRDPIEACLQDEGIDGHNLCEWALLETLALTWLADRLPTDLAVRVYEKLSGLIVSHVDDHSIYDRPVTAFIQAVELPLTLHCLNHSSELPDGPGISINRFLDRFIELLLDEQGWLLEEYIDIWPRLMASWVRCQLLAQALSQDVFSQSSEGMLSLFVRQALRSLDREFCLLFSKDTPVSTTTPPSKWSRALIEAMVRCTGDDDNRVISKYLTRGKPVANTFIDDHSCSISEPCQIAVLRESWRPDASSVAIRFGQRDMWCSLTRKIRLFEVAGLPKVAIDGQSIGPTSDWELVGEHIDNNVNFVEFQLTMESGVALQRQFLISYEDQFAVISDAVTASNVHQFSYSMQLELPRSITALEETENHEIYLREGKTIKALLLPLSLSEWRGQRDGCFRLIGDHSIELTQHVTGRAMYSPLWIDLSPRRSLQPRTWRQLTVGEELQVVPPDVAAAFRVQVGSEQWVVYRSLANPANRTFLGVNQLCEMYYGRFKKRGTDEILMVN